MPVADDEADKGRPAWEDLIGNSDCQQGDNVSCNVSGNGNSNVNGNGISTGNLISVV